MRLNRTAATCAQSRPTEALACLLSLSLRPRKRFGQTLCPKWFLRIFCGIKELRLGTADDSADSLSTQLSRIKPSFRGDPPGTVRPSMLWIASSKAQLYCALQFLNQHSGNRSENTFPTRSGLRYVLLPIISRYPGCELPKTGSHQSRSCMRMGYETA